MKSTGIVRRIDDLGRIVIPKAVREQLNLKAGDALELFTEGGAVIYKKYYDNTVCELITDIQDYLLKEDYEHPNKEKILELMGQAKCLIDVMAVKEKMKDDDTAEWIYWEGWVGNHDKRIDDAKCSSCGYIHHTVYRVGPIGLSDTCPICGKIMKKHKDGAG